MITAKMVKYMDGNETVYTVTCDECKYPFGEDEDGSIDDDTVWMINGKHYCTECARERFAADVQTVISIEKRIRENARKNRVNHKSNQG